MERDADDHLAERGAGQCAGAAKRLRAEDHMDAEIAASESGSARLNTDDPADAVDFLGIPASSLGPA